MMHVSIDLMLLSNEWKSVMIVTPFPMVVLFFGGKCGVLAVFLVTAVPIRVVDYDFMVVPSVIVVVVCIVVVHPSGATKAGNR